MAAKRFPFHRLGAVITGFAVASVAALGFTAPANGQSTAALSMVIAPEIPAGSTISTLPTNVGQRIFIQITNSGSVALTNQQFVVRVAQKPDLISAVNDGVGNIGLIDPNSGAWYHTIAQLPPGITITYSISTLKYCPGRWPIAARVGDKVAISYASWVGPPDARCVADETTNPVPASYYTLAWPATGAPPIVGSGGSTSTIGPQPTTTLAGTGAIATIPGATGATTTTIVGPKPTLINLTLTATTTTTTIATPANSVGTKSGSSATTTILFCKTVGGKRYCAPKYSVYKPGQKKVLEKKATAANKRKAAAARAARARR